MEKLYVIKIGGNVIDDEKLFQSFALQFSSVSAKKILVHGGGKIATEIGKSLNIESKYVNGRRVTNDATLQLVTMVYGGLINKKIVAHLQSIHCNAIGLTGADGNLLLATKRINNEVDFGWVGDTDKNNVNTSLLKSLLNEKLIPVIAPLTHDGKGNILNTNADTIASVIATALSKTYEVHLIFCFEKRGVLNDMNDENSVIPTINDTGFVKLKAENKINSGILPKIENALQATGKGVCEVVIGKAEDLLQNTSESVIGTRII
jgi:acetylglutamate kinase